MTFAVADLVDCLALQPDGPDTFLGSSPQAGWQRLFGGLVLGQALAAMERSCAERPAHALHALFLRPGDPALPTRYAVTRLRDGRSFSARQCIASQGDAVILTAFASFQDGEEGLEHQTSMPDVPAPETLPTMDDILARFGASLPSAMRAYLGRERVVDLRPVDLSRLAGEPVGGGQVVWLRVATPLPVDAGLHRAVLAYLSDLTLLDVTLAQHGGSIFDSAVQAASLDHALWLHRPVQADDWMLYVQDSPSAGNGRGFARGSIFSRDGHLVASVAQEGLIRRR